MSIQSCLILCIMKLGKIHNFNLDIPKNTENLRKFHNWIKLQLILNAAKTTNAQSLLDIAVGRGGDLSKWARAKIKFVTGIDSDSDAIFGKESTTGFDGAIERFQGMKRTKRFVPKSFFWKLSALDPDILGKLNNKDFNKIYDIVSCQFAFHYFIENIDHVLSMISSKLRTGGFFIGTTSDGDMIKENLNNGDIILPILSIINKTDKEYIYHLNADQPGRVSFFEYKGTISEYFVLKDYFTQKASEHSLKLVELNNFSNWYKTYVNNNVSLSYQEQIVSFFNFSFIFIKV
jgi:mRNA (guanine-N7-)-methyltransferase